MDYFDFVLCPFHTIEYISFASFLIASSIKIKAHTHFKQNFQVLWVTFCLSHFVPSYLTLTPAQRNVAFCFHWNLFDYLWCHEQKALTYQDILYWMKMNKMREKYSIGDYWNEWWTKLPKVSLIFEDLASAAVVEIGSIQNRRKAMNTWPSNMAKTGWDTGGLIFRTLLLVPAKEKINILNNMEYCLLIWALVVS